MTANGQEQEESSDTGEGWADTAPLLQKEESLSSENRGSASGSSSTLREGVHLIQIHRLRESSGSDGEIDPCSPDQPQCRICLDSDGNSSSLRFLDPTPKYKGLLVYQGQMFWKILDEPPNFPMK